MRVAGSATGVRPAVRCRRRSRGPARCPGATAPAGSDSCAGAGNAGAACQRASAIGTPRRLRHVQRGLVVHVLVQQREAEEVQRVVVVGRALRAAAPAWPAAVLPVRRCVACGIGQRQCPAAVVRHRLESYSASASARVPGRRGVGRVGRRALAPGRVARQPVRPGTSRCGPAPTAAGSVRRACGTASSGSAAAQAAKVASVSRRLACSACASSGAAARRTATPSASIGVKLGSCTGNRILIVTPALADANNGNWQTARRWSRMLASAYRVQLCADWPAGGAGARPARNSRPTRR